MDGVRLARGDDDFVRFLLLLLLLGQVEEKRYPVFEVA